MGGKARASAISALGTLEAQCMRHVTALKQLAERMRTKVNQVNNSQLRVGSLMHYYCELCTHWAIALPEGHREPPPEHCKACKELLDASGLTPFTLRVLVRATCPLRMAAP